jgi:hypothetical protein
VARKFGWRKAGGWRRADLAPSEITFRNQIQRIFEVGTEPLFLPRVHTLAFIEEFCGVAPDGATWKYRRGGNKYLSVKCLWFGAISKIKLAKLRQVR